MKRFQVFFIFVLLLTSQAGVYGYSVLSHEAVIDTAWEKSLQPLLLHRFPTLMPDQLRQAHAYAYGGCIIQDLGYYPFGSKLFSDLVHYVRSGDFVQVEGDGIKEGALVVTRNNYFVSDKAAIEIDSAQEQKKPAGAKDD